MAITEIIPVSLQRECRYQINIERAGLSRGYAILRDTIRQDPQSRCFLLTDATVHRLYSQKLLNSFHEKLPVLSLPPGERIKTLPNALAVYKKLLKLHFNRRDILIGMGGGTVCDLTGFVAATFMRGIPYYLIPSSLVAQIDAAIGGKVGVNLAQAKNIIGSFYHPAGILIDPSLLTTLPTKEIRNGLSEMIKTAIIASENLFAFIEKNWQALLKKQKAFDEAISETIKIKLRLLAKDPFENNLKRHLNFGHTIAHSLETITHYKKISHGEAVSMGMALATRIARTKGHCNNETAERILALLENIGLPTRWPEKITPEHLQNEIKKVTTIRNGHLYFVLPQSIGTTLIDESITVQDLLDGEHF